MESTNPTGPEGIPGKPVNAAADLELLSRAKSSAHIDQFLDFGPWWYAPLLATTIGGLTLFGQAFSSFFWNGVVGIVAVTAGGAMAVHDYRRRTVLTRPSSRGAVFVGMIVILCWILIAAWGTAISTLGHDRFVPGYAALGWVLTSLFFLGTRMILMALRRQRTPLL